VNGALVTYTGTTHLCGNIVNKMLSCCCDSRSYCVRCTVYWQTIKPVSVYKLTNGWYARSDSTGRVYELTQTPSTQAWPM